MKAFFKTPLSIRSWGAFACIGIVLLASVWLLFLRLGAEPFQDYDEATYAEVTTESLAQHSYLTFSFLGQEYFDKPPLLFWFMDASKSVFGDTEFGNRFPSALAGLALIITVLVITYAVTQNAYAAALAGAILATTSAFIEPARQVRFDILVSLFITLSVFGFLKAMDDRRWFLWYGAFIGLSVLSKGPLVLYALVPSLAMAAIYRSWKWIISWYFWVGVGIAAILILPWHLYETLAFGSSFWETYLFGQVVHRVQQVFFTLQPTNLEYLEYFFQFSAPWSLGFIGAIFCTPFIWKDISLERKALLVSSYVGITTVFTVCFITKTKAFSYLIPLYPFMALACAVVAIEFMKFKKVEFKIFLVALLACFSLLGFAWSVYNDFHINRYYAGEVSLAEQEKHIGQLLFSMHTNVFYTYDVTTVGSVIYYSGIISPIQISSETRLPKGSLILCQTSELAQVEAQFPHETILYRGSSLTLARFAE